MAVVWCRAAADILSGIPLELAHRWQQRGRVRVPDERRSLMIGSDIRFAWRSLNHQRFGSLLVIGMLALGIGSTVAVFSLVNGLFLQLTENRLEEAWIGDMEWRDNIFSEIDYRVYA